MLKQSLQQKLSQKLSPQQIKLMKLIQLPTIELEQKVQEEIEANPAIEEGVDESESPEFEDYEDRDVQHVSADEINVDEYLSDDEVPRYRLVANNSSPDQEDKSIPVAMGSSSTQLLESQLALRVLDDHLYQIGLYLIGCINDNGFIRRDLDLIVDDLLFTQNITTDLEELKEVLGIIQDFEPVGIGAVDLQDTMLIQLSKKAETEVVLVSKEIVKNHFNALSKKHYDKLLSKLSINEDLLKK